MSPILRSVARTIRWPILFSFVALIAAPVWAQTTILQVEEHWELRLGQPDPDLSAPQVTMSMSPEHDLGGLHFLFALNHLTLPSYAPGGMQVQAWDGGQPLQDSIASQSAPLVHADEVVSWVQRLSVEDGTLRFQVLDGASETWGEFGGSDLSLSLSTSITNLNDYRPGVSLTESQVGYAENRVASLILTKLVWITDDGEVHEMNAPIAIDTSLDP